MVSLNINTYFSFLNPLIQRLPRPNAALALVSTIALAIILGWRCVYARLTKPKKCVVLSVEKDASRPKLETSGSAGVSEQIHNLIIIGGGMSGLTTAIFAGQERLSPVVITGDNSEAQLPLITQVTNFAGHSDGISGQQLLSKTTEQAQKFGASLLPGKVIDVDLSRRPFKLTLSNGKTILSKSIVVATGTFQKRLGLASETRLNGKGVYDNAIKDAHLCKGKHIIVVGGGNSAMGEVLELAKFAKAITIIYDKSIYASPSIRENIIKTGKTKILENTQITEICGKEKVTGIVIKNLVTQETQLLPSEGLFVSNGRPVNTSLFRGKLEMDEEGVIKISSGKTGTSIPGVFAVGDARRPLKYRKLLAAAGDGTEAAIDAKEYLENLSKTPKSDEVKSNR